MLRGGRREKMVFAGKGVGRENEEKENFTFCSYCCYTHLPHPDPRLHLGSRGVRFDFFNLLQTAGKFSSFFKGLYASRLSIMHAGQKYFAADRCQ